MPTIQAAITEAKAKSISTLEAEILLAYTLELPRTYFHAWPEKQIDEASYHRFMAYVERCKNGEPLAYVTGRREFWSLDIDVTPDVLIPRPETELLVESALRIGDRMGSTLIVADLGTGSGAISLALAKERPDWLIYATDISEAALMVAKQNAQRLSLSNISFYHGHWCHALPDMRFDLIVSNPPYISEQEWPLYAKGLAFEPYQALVSGEAGLDAIDDISREAKNRLRSKGYILIEHGFSQARSVREMLATQGYSDVCTIRDLFDKERVTLGCMLS